MIFVFFIIAQFFLTFVLYYLLKRKLSSYSPLDRYRDEMNSLIIAFNRNAEENITVLEKKIEEALSLNLKLEKKIQDYKEEIILQRNVFPSEIEREVIQNIDVDGIKKLEKKKERQNRSIKGAALVQKKTRISFEQYLDKALEKGDLRQKKASEEKKELSLEEKIKELSSKNTDVKFLAKELQISLDEVNFLMKKYRLTA